MNKATLNALEKSIVHWEENLSAAKSRRYGEINIEREACALCSIFWVEACMGCPVRVQSGRPSCKGTPYMEVNDIVGKANFEFGWKGITRAVRKELVYLKSLLPD